MSAVHGPTPFTGDKRVVRVLGVERGETRKIEPPVGDRLGERAQRADLRRREPAGAQFLLGRGGEPNRVERRDAGSRAGRKSRSRWRPTPAARR